MQRIAKVQRDFLWNDSVDKKKYHLVRWETVCQPIDKGGLGICSIEKVNKVLLGKWLWRVGETDQGLWRKILLKKYNLGNDGWWVPGHGYKASDIWKSTFCQMILFL